MSTEQLYGPPKVGVDILSYCSKCKMDLAHVIVSMVDTKPIKVICKTCRGTHNYKKGAPGTPLLRSSRPSKPRKAAEKTYVKVADMWEQKLADKKAAPMRPYSIQESFAVGDVIQHPNFGVGLVEQVRLNGKMTVLFREAEKILVHGMMKS